MHHRAPTKLAAPPLLLDDFHNAAGVYAFSAPQLCYEYSCYDSITPTDTPVWAGKASAITGQWEGGAFWVYFIGGNSGASNSIIRMASSPPYTATTLATSAGVGFNNDLFRGLALSPALPVVAPPIVALRLTNGGAALSSVNGNAIVLDTYNATTLVSSTPVPPALCSLDGAPFQTYVYGGRISRSADSLNVTLACFASAAGTPVASAARALVSINASNRVSSPLSTAVLGPSLMSATQTASGAYYVGAGGAQYGLFYVSPTGVSTTLSSTLDIASVMIYSGSLWVASPFQGIGVYLVGSSGVLPVNAGVTYTLITADYTYSRWATAFVFQSPTSLWITDGGYNVGAYRSCVCLATFTHPHALPPTFCSRHLRLQLSRPLLHGGLLLIDYAVRVAGSGGNLYEHHWAVRGGRLRAVLCIRQHRPGQFNHAHVDAVVCCDDRRIDVHDRRSLPRSGTCAHHPHS